MRKITELALTAALLVPGLLTAGEKKLMHCFAFTEIESASDDDWKAFYKATDALPRKMPGIVSKVWYGKLGTPLGQFQVDAESGKKLRAGEKTVTAAANRLVRKYGACMEIADESSIKKYADHPYHKEWLAAYEKVRVAGTTTFDIIGQ